MTARGTLLSLLLLLAPTMHAADLAGSNVLVPVAGRTSGAYGSQWQTDLVITNLNVQPVPLVLTFYGPDDDRSFTTRSLAGRGTMVLGDVLSTIFQRPTGVGMIRVSSAQVGARITARAYIYNRAAGEYGQGVPAVPVDALTSEHVLSGITSSDGRRTNVGVANPWPVPASVTLSLVDAQGQQRAQLHRIVPPFEVLQVNDAFAAFGVTPVAEASVRVLSQVSVYAYASVVRNDTGDAVFVPGTGIGVRMTGEVAPRCTEPASLGLAKPGQKPAEGWIVIMKPETTLQYITNVLPAQHGYTLTTVYDMLPGFAAELTQQQIAALRCDGAVEFIEQNVAY